MNRVVLVGRLTRDPELRTSGSGNSFVNFSVAVNRNYTSNSGEREADFINCIAFNKQAENLCRYIRKGGLVGIDGRLQTRSYTAQDNTKRTVMEVICDTINFLEPKNAGAPRSTGNDYDYMDYSPYDMPSTPSAPRYNNNYQQGNGYQNNYQNNGYQNPQNNYQRPQNNGPKDLADEIQNQFGITDDDLPF
jgi:single-strand DNA-binding protein